MSKLMDVVEKQVLRGRVLRICNLADPMGAGSEVIHSALKKEGFGVSKEEVAAACRYLEGKRLIRIENVNNEILEISRDISHITSAGIDALEGTLRVEGVELS